MQGRCDTKRPLRYLYEVVSPWASPSRDMFLYWLAGDSIITRGRVMKPEMNGWLRNIGKKANRNRAEQQ